MRAPSSTPGRLLATACALGALSGALRAQEGGIEVFAGETLFAEGTRVSLSHLLRRRSTLLAGTDEVADPLDRTALEQRLVLGIDHGLRHDLTLSALVPFVWKELESDAGTVEGSGLGDVALLAKVRFYKRDWPRSSLNVALVGGVELPTGESRARDGGVLLPPSLQPGSGSWDPFAALSTTLSLDRWRFDGLLFHKLNTEGEQDHEAGDFLALEADVAWRFLHTQYPGPTAAARVGLQWRHEGRAHQDGVAVADSGSTALVLRPGLGWHPTPGTDVSLSVDLPMYEDVEGTQLGLGVRTILALGFRF